MGKNRGVGGPRSLPVAEWKRRIQALRDSGLTLTAFCRREKISRGDLQHWRRRLEGAVPPVAGSGKRMASRKRARPSFAEVRVRPDAASREAAPPPPPSFGVALVLASGDRMLLPEGCDPRWLGQALRALRSGPCRRFRVR